MATNTLDLVGSIERAVQVGLAMDSDGIEGMLLVAGFSLLGASLAVFFSFLAEAGIPG